MKKVLIIALAMVFLIAPMAMAGNGNGPAAEADVPPPCAVSAAFVNGDICVTWAEVPEAEKYSIDLTFWLEVDSDYEFVAKYSFSSRDYPPTETAPTIECNSVQVDAIEMCIPLVDVCDPAMVDLVPVCVPFDLEEASHLEAGVKGLNPSTGPKKQNNDFEFSGKVEIPD